MTRTQLRSLIRKRLGETTAAFWSDPELNDWINDAGHEVAWMTKCIKRKGYMTPTEDTSEYSLSSISSTLLSLDKVYYYQNAQSWMELIPTNKDDLDMLDSGWLNAQSGTPTKFYWDKEQDVFVLYVPPDSTNAGVNYCQVYYADDFTEITLDAPEIAGIPESLQRAMADFVAAYGFETRGYGEKSNNAWSQFLARIRNYQSVRNDEKDTTGEDIVMKNYRNT